MKTVKKIMTIWLSCLLNGEHFNFMRDLIELLLKAGPQKLKIENELAILLALYDQEAKVFDPIRSSEFTELICKADAVRVSILKGLESLVCTNLKNPDEDTAAAAKRLKLLLKSHPNIHNRSYSIKTAVVTDVIIEIKQGYTAEIAQINASDWLTKLEETNNDFIALMGRRFKNKSEQNTVNMVNLRQQMDKTYLDIATRLEAMITMMEDPEEYLPFMVELNEYIKYYNERVKLRRTNNRNKRQNIAKAQLSAIGAQTYNGGHIVPEIELVYTNTKTGETLLLVEGKDYTFVVEGNAQPGMATLTIKGKGAYVGKLISTFTIVE